MRKNWIRNISSILLAGVLLMGTSLTAAAADRSGTVRLYLPTGDRPTIQFEAGDSFFTYDNVIPGDTLTQEIQIENRRNERATFYLKATTPTNTALLDKLTLEIKRDSTVIYKGKLTGTASSAYGDMTATNGVRLGEWSANSTQTITAVISVPVEVDNASIRDMGSIKWQLRAEIRDPSTTTTDSRTSTGTSQLDTDSRLGNTVTIGDEDVPLADNLYNIPENQTPLASLPKTGGSSLFLMGYGLSALAAGVVLKK